MTDLNLPSGIYLIENLGDNVLSLNRRLFGFPVAKTETHGSAPHRFIYLSP